MSAGGGLAVAKFWTPERIRRLREIAQSGRSMAEAARALKCTRNAVAGAASRNDIPFDCPPMRHRKLCSIGLTKSWERRRQAESAQP